MPKLFHATCFALSTILTTTVLAFSLFMLTTSVLMMKQLYSQSDQGWLLPSAESIQCKNIQPNTNESTCEIVTTPLQDGRYRLAANYFNGNQLQLQLDKVNEVDPSLKTLMLRKGYNIFGKPSVAQLTIQIKADEEPAQRYTLSAPNNWFSQRFYYDLPSYKKSLLITLSAENDSATPEELILDEVALSYDNHAPGIISRILATSHWKSLIIKVVGFLLLSLLCLAQLSRSPKRYHCLLLMLVCAFSSFHLTNTLYRSFSPETHRDLRVTFASGTLQESPGSNLNYGLHMGSNTLKGNGPVIIKNIPHWARMPGYGFLMALASLSLDSPDNLLEIGMRGVLFQLLITSFMAVFFFCQARKIMPAFVAAIITLLIILIPNQLYYIQIESIMPAIYLFNMGLACLFLANQDDTNNQPKLRYHLLLHLGFALWFSIRTDVVPAWFLVSIALYCRHLKDLKYLVIPCIYAAAIALAWGAFKYPMIHEFSPTTNSIGASLMVGLWEIPHKFIWVVSDSSYINFVKRYPELSPVSKAASDLTQSEVFRFYVTFPGYIIALIWHKFYQFMSMLSFGSDSKFSWNLILLSAMASSFLMRYKPKQTLLLGWAFLFNLPVFLFAFSSLGRFYFVPSIALLTAGIALLLDVKFYQSIGQHKIKCLLIVTLACGYYFFAESIDNRLIESDNFRYWTPILNAEDSALYQLKNSQ